MTLVQQKIWSVRRASKEVGCTRHTLAKYLKNPPAARVGQGRYHTVFSKEEEHQLAQFCLDSSDQFYGITKDSLAHLAYEFAEINGISHPFNKETKKAGRDWIDGFLKRNPQLSLRTPESMSISIATSINQGNAIIFYDNADSVAPDEPLQKTIKDISEDANAQVCANCCSSFVSSSSSSSTTNTRDVPSDFLLPEAESTCGIEDSSSADVNKMLSEIYNLDFIPRLEQKYETLAMKTKEVDLSLCESCTNLLKSLFSLYSQFNQIRKIESLLSSQINSLNSLINYDQNQSQPSNEDSTATFDSTSSDILNLQEITTATINNSSSSSQFEILSNDLTLEEIDCAPSSPPHMYQEAPESNLIISDVLSTQESPSILSHGNGNHHDDENDMDYESSLLSDPLCYEEEEVKPVVPLFETESEQQPEFPKKVRKSTRKSSSRKRSSPAASTSTNTTIKRKKPEVQEEEAAAIIGGNEVVSVKVEGEVENSCGNAQTLDEERQQKGNNRIYYPGIKLVRVHKGRRTTGGINFIPPSSTSSSTS